MARPGAQDEGEPGRSYPDWANPQGRARVPMPPVPPKVAVPPPARRYLGPDATPGQPPGNPTHQGRATVHFGQGQGTQPQGHHDQGRPEQGRPEQGRPEQGPVGQWAGPQGTGPQGPGTAARGPAKPRKRRRLLWTSLGLVVLLFVGAGAALVIRPAPVRALLGEPTATASPTPSPPPPQPVLGDVAGTSPPTAAGLAAAVDALAADPRVGSLSASIVDVASGTSLYDRAGQEPKVPASVTKLVTAAAVLAARGPGYRLATRAVAGSAPGEVVLVGAGDPTLAVDRGDTYRGAARLDDLAAQVKRKLGTTRPTRVLVDSSVFTGSTLGPGWDSDIALYGYGAPVTGLMVNGGRVRPRQQAPRSRQPDVAAGQAFARLLGVPPDAVTVGRAGPDAAELGSVQSLSVLRLVEIMLRDSDNVVAEALARQVVLARGGQGSFAGAAQATLEVLKDLGLPIEGVRLSDGSGLSRNNRLTTSLLAGLLTLAASDDHARLSGLFAGLPVAGYSGTLHDRFVGESRPAVGLVRAKTGTLNGVSALAGVVVDADGRLLSFSLIANRVPGGADAAEVVLDRIAAALAGCGCR